MLICREVMIVEIMKPERIKNKYLKNSIDSVVSGMLLVLEVRLKSLHIVFTSLVP